MEEKERDSIEFFFNQKETDDLFCIWNNHDTEEWREEAFEVMEKILISRTGEKPVHFEAIEINKTNKPYVDYSEDDQPVFYNPDEVENIGLWLSRAWIFAVGISFIISLTNFNSMYSMVYSWFYSAQIVRFHLFIVFIVSIIMVANMALSFVLFYFPLKAFGQVLKILKEMEFNSRKR